MKLKIQIFAMLAMLCLSATAAENYFRPGTVWTIIIDTDVIPSDHISYNTILDEITFEGEKVLPFAYYNDEDPEPKVERYLRTDGDKVYWRSTDPESPEWYLLYDFGLKVGDEVVVYCMHNEDVEPATLKCVRYDFYLNDNPLYGPLMTLQTMRFLNTDYDIVAQEHNQGEWIIGMGYQGGPGSILDPHYWGWVGGGTEILCVESPKGNVVYGNPVAGIKTVNDSDSSLPGHGVYNMQGIRVADTTENLPAGIYVVNGRKIVIN